MTPPSITQVSPPRPDLEGWAVVALAGILLQATLLGAALRAPAAATQTALQPGPGEIALSGLPVSHRRVATELLVGVEDLGLLRDPRSRRWPTPAILADEGVPPFADDPVGSWELDDLAGAATYFRGGALPGWLLEVAEGLAPALDPSHSLTGLATRDHRRLSDDSVIHFKLWWHPASLSTIPANPGLAGWQRVLVTETRTP